MSSSSGKSLRRHTVANGNCCSTPFLGKEKKLSTLSVSAVNTYSSSSTGKERIVKSPIRAKNIKKKQVKKKKLRNRKIRKQSSKLKKSTVATDSDTDWETKSEVYIYGDAESPQISTKKSSSSSESAPLFIDLRSPEQIREAPSIIPERLESPIFQPRQREIKSARRISFELEEALPLKDLPSINLRLDDTDDEEEELILRKENALKTYLSVGKKKQPRDVIRVDKCKEWLVDVSIPTVSSDLLWDSFVEKNYEKVQKYLAQPSTRAQHKFVRCDASHSAHYPEMNNANNEGRVLSGNIQRNKEDIKNKQSSKLSNMDVACGYWSNTLKKWIRVKDVYKYLDDEPNKLQQNSETEGKMSLNQFLHRCKVERKKKQQQSNLSMLATLENNENNSECSRNLECDQCTADTNCFHSKCTENKVTEENVSDDEIDRVNNILKFASRMSVRRKRRIFESSSSSEENTLQTDQYEFSKQSRKQTKKRNIRVVENNVSLEKMVQNEPTVSLNMSNKPKIKSTERLRALRYKKYKQNWRII